MIEDMQLRGLSPKTQQAYVRVVRQLAEYYNRSPDQIDEEELRVFFLYLKNEKCLSRSSCTVALCGLKFFYEYTLKRRWPVFQLIRQTTVACVSVNTAQEGEESPGRVKHGGSVADSQLSAPSPLSGVLEHDLCLRSAY
jgi:hypothetical protein